MRSWHRIALAASLSLFVAGCDSPPTDRPGADPRYGQLEQAATICAAGATVEGIDVSSWQGNIDWTQVAGAGKVFAIARIGDGLSHDSYFAQNWAGIKNAGMIRGAYQYFRTGDDPGAQADIVVAAVGVLGPGDLPVTIDVEEPSPSVGPAAYNQAIHTWVDRVQQGTGKKPIIYTGRYYWNPYVATSDFVDNALWHAQYTLASCPNIADQWGNWTMWQYRADPYPPVPGGTCPGVSGWVDLDVFNGSIDDLNAFANAVVNHPPIGWLDSAGCDAIAGWSQDPDAPTQSIDVHIYFDGPAGDPSATGIPVHADVNRADLCTAIGSCNHGYSLATPYSFQDGKPHEVHAYGIDTGGGTNPELGASPQTLTCPLPAFPVPADKGVKRHIPDIPTMSNWKMSWTDVVVLSDGQLDGIAVGPDLVASPQLVQAAGDPAVYILENRTLRHVISGDSMAAWRFDWAQIQQVTAADLLKDITGADLFARPFLVRGSGPAIYVYDNPPPLWAVPSSDDAPTSLSVGQKRKVTFQLLNRGAIFWKPGEVFLAPSSPRDQASVFCDSATWKSCTRAVSVASETAPGATGKFVVTLRAPASAGAASACFNLVYKDSFWFSDVGQMGPKDDALCHTINLVAEPAGLDAGEEPQPGEDGGSVVVVGDDGGSVVVKGDGGSAVRPDASGAQVSAGCGCGSTGSSGAGVSFALLAIAALWRGRSRGRGRS